MTRLTTPGPPSVQFANKKVLKKLKDECAGRAIAEYVGLRPKMYLRLQRKHQEGEGCKKECREEAHQARAVQRGPLRKANLLPWHGCIVVRAQSHLWATSEQGLSLTLCSKRWIAKKWGGYAGVWHRDAVLAECRGVD